jgi:hypothetical protein
VDRRGPDAGHGLRLSSHRPQALRLIAFAVRDGKV